jgi:SNF2 family DNA or RNA helicase
MKPEESQAEKRRFNEDPECRVLVAQQAASCMGHTLIGGEGADVCSRMVYYENSFGLRDRLQMNDRIHRGAQKEICQYYDLVCSPMDEKVIGALTRKKNEADMLDGILTSLRRGELY